MDKLSESQRESGWSDGYALRRALEAGSLEQAISVLKGADPCVARDSDVCALALACRMGKPDFAKLFRPELIEPMGWRAMAVEKLGATDFWVRWLDDKSSSALAQAAFEAASLGSLECLEAVMPAPSSKWAARMAGVAGDGALKNFRGHVLAWLKDYKAIAKECGAIEGASDHAREQSRARPKKRL